MTGSSPSVFEPCAHTKLDFCGMIRFFVVSFIVVILNAALAALSDKGQCVCVCGGGGGVGLLSPEPPIIVHYKFDCTSL